MPTVLVPSAVLLHRSSAGRRSIQALGLTILLLIAATNGIGREQPLAAAGSAAGKGLEWMRRTATSPVVSGTIDPGLDRTAEGSRSVIVQARAGAEDEAAAAVQAAGGRVGAALPLTSGFEATGTSWTGTSWTSAFWGDQPKSGQTVPGERSASRS